MLITVNEANQIINKGKILFMAGDETLLKQLDKGNWVGGTITYFMDHDGGVTTKNKVFATELNIDIEKYKINWYDEKELNNIPANSYENGFSFIIIPALSKSHINFAQNAPNYKDIFLKPLIGWISGSHLNDMGKITPKVFNGLTKESSDQKAIVMHIQLPLNKLTDIGIINLFKQGDGDTITFEKEGFSIKECMINGKKEIFSDYLLHNKIDTKYPLVADYNGAMINVSFQEIKENEGVVNLYAPVFKGVEYKLASPLENYVKEFQNQFNKINSVPIFACNCILNYLYSELEGKKTGDMVGPITFGEIAYQLLNQTMVYLNVLDV